MGTQTTPQIRLRKKKRSQTYHFFANRLMRWGYSTYGLVARTRKPYEYLFVLGHMRAGSSLLTQLLAAHPEIMGYGETHLPYRDKRDLQALVGKTLFVLRRFQRPGPERYIVDKLLHNYLLLEPGLNLVRQHNIRILFLIRSPESALSSIVRTLQKTNAWAVNYYTNRLQYIAEYAAHISATHPCAYVTYDELVHNTPLAFQRIESYLGLQYALSNSYALEANIDKNSQGVDPSAHLRAGRILRNITHDPITFDADQLATATAAYNTCLATLAKHCPPTPLS